MAVSEHGGDIYFRKIEYDFSANLNPLGMPGGVKNALRNSVSGWESYPDPLCRKLISALSDFEKIPPENIVCGNGAADLIYRIVAALKPQKAVISAPTFSEYEKAFGQSGSSVVKHYLSEENEFLLDDSILEILDSSIDMLFLCSPNNPTGRTINPDLLKRICDKCLAENIIFVCDECFMPFVSDAESRSARNFLNGNVIILKAFTKIFAMAGIRLGYAVFGSKLLAGTLRKTGQFWSVSTPAQIAGEAALKEKEYLKKTAELVGTERNFITSELQKTGIIVYPSETNFLLFRCGLPLDELLIKEKIAIRNCGNFEGLNENYFRVAVRNHRENLALISAVRRVLGG
ncbi:MAG: pyridoxal phosphate-dependent aminotransferase [Ruminiclostridium sp.]